MQLGAFTRESSLSWVSRHLLKSILAILHDLKYDIGNLKEPKKFINLV